MKDMSFLRNPRRTQAQHKLWSICLFYLVAMIGGSAAQQHLACASPTPTVRIALVGDPHVTRGTNSDQPLYRARFEKTIAAVNAQNVDWVLIAGDLTQSGKPEEIADFRELIRGFRAPVAWVYGNHDVGAKVSGKEETKGEINAARLERIETALGPSFWQEERAGVQVVGVNASLFGSALPQEAKQWAFLEKAFQPRLADGTNTSRKPVILLSHYPLFIKTPEETDEQNWNIEPISRTRLMKLLQDAKVDAVFSAHLHRPLMHHHAGMLLVTAPPVSFGLPRGKQPQGWTLVTFSGQGEFQVEQQQIQD